MTKDKPLSEKIRWKDKRGNPFVDGLLFAKDVAEHVERLKEELNERWNLYYGEEVVKEHIKIIDKIFGEFHNNTKLADTAKDNYSPQGMSSKKTHLFEMLPEDTHARQPPNGVYEKGVRVGLKEGCGKITESIDKFHVHRCGEDDWLCPKCEVGK